MRRNSSLIYILVSLACKVIYIILTSWLLTVTFSFPIPKMRICIKYASQSAFWWFQALLNSNCVYIQSVKVIKYHVFTVYAKGINLKLKIKHIGLKQWGSQKLWESPMWKLLNRDILFHFHLMETFKTP